MAVDVSCPLDPMERSPPLAISDRNNNPDSGTEYLTPGNAYPEPKGRQSRPELVWIWVATGEVIHIQINSSTRTSMSQDMDKSLRISRPPNRTNVVRLHRIQQARGAQESGWKKGTRIAL